MKLIWTENAVKKLEEFADFIALDNPQAALKWTEEIRKSVNKIEHFSQLGRIVPETKRNDIHEIIEGNYRIIYRIESDRIAILTIRHCKQLLRENDVLKKNRSV